MNCPASVLRKVTPVRRGMECVFEDEVGKRWDACAGVRIWMSFEVGRRLRISSGTLDILYPVESMCFGSGISSGVEVMMKIVPLKM